MSTYRKWVDRPPTQHLSSLEPEPDALLLSSSHHPAHPERCLREPSAASLRSGRVAPTRGLVSSRPAPVAAPSQHPSAPPLEPLHRRCSLPRRHGRLSLFELVPGLLLDARRRAPASSFSRHQEPRRPRPPFPSSASQRRSPPSFLPQRRSSLSRAPLRRLPRSSLASLLCRHCSQREQHQASSYNSSYTVHVQHLPPALAGSFPASPWTRTRKQEHEPGVLSSPRSCEDARRRGKTTVDVFALHRQLKLKPQVLLPGPKFSKARLHLLPRQSGDHLVPIPICFFLDRIAKWCGEIRQVLRMFLGKL
nr:uncharacterized protein LOC127319642 [Lolium perenne]